MAHRISLPAALLIGAVICGCTTYFQPVTHPSEYVDREGERAFEEAMALVEDGKLDEAQALLLELVNGYPDFFRARHALQDIALQREGEQPARQAARAQLEVRRDPMTLTLAARTLPDVDDQIKLLEEALSLDESYVWAHYGLAFIILREERISEYEAARTHLEQALEYAQTFRKARLLLIECLRRLGDYGEQDLEYAVHIEQNPDDVTARYNYADLLSTRLEEYDAALEQVDAVLDLEPERIDALLLKGLILCQAGEYSQAETQYLEIVHRHPSAVLNLAFLYKDHLDSPENALKYFRMYLAYSGDNVQDKTFLDERILVPTYVEKLGKELE